MKFDGIILDVDGTLWDVTKVTANSWNRALKDVDAHDPPVTPQILKQEFGKTMSKIAEDIFPMLYTEKEKYDEFCSLRSEYEALDVMVTKEKITYDGVRETIEKCLASSPLKFYVVSNCAEGYIELMSRKLDIKNFITDFESFGNTGKGKAENLTDLIQRNKIERPLYVGDTQGDANECKKAGVPFVWASYGYGKTVDSYFAKIDSFPELEKIICQ